MLMLTAIYEHYQTGAIRANSTDMCDGSDTVLTLINKPCQTDAVRTELRREVR